MRGLCIFERCTLHINVISPRPKDAFKRARRGNRWICTRGEDGKWRRGKKSGVTSIETFFALPLPQPNLNILLSLSLSLPILRSPRIFIHEFIYEVSHLATRYLNLFVKLLFVIYKIKSSSSRHESCNKQTSEDIISSKLL